MIRRSARCFSDGNEIRPTSPPGIDAIRVRGRGWRRGKAEQGCGLTDGLSSCERELAVLESSDGLERGPELERSDRGRREQGGEGEVTGRRDDGHCSTHEGEDGSGKKSANRMSSNARSWCRPSGRTIVLLSVNLGSLQDEETDIKASGQYEASRAQTGGCVQGAGEAEGWGSGRPARAWPSASGASSSRRPWAPIADGIHTRQSHDRDCARSQGPRSSQVDWRRARLYRPALDVRHFVRRRNPRAESTATSPTQQTQTLIAILLVCDLPSDQND